MGFISGKKIQNANVQTNKYKQTTTKTKTVLVTKNKYMRTVFWSEQ